MHHPTDRITHTTAFVVPVVGHWLEREIAQWVHPMKDWSDDPSHHERTLYLWATSRSGKQGASYEELCGYWPFSEIMFTPAPRSSFILSSQRLAVLLQAVPKGWNSLVSCPHRSYTFDPFIYLEERSSTSVWALSVYSDSSPHFGGVQSFCARKERYIW